MLLSAKPLDLLAPVSPHIEGSQVSFVAEFSAPRRPGVARVNWGDGTTERIRPTFARASHTAGLTAAHDYARAGNYQLTYSVRGRKGWSQPQALFAPVDQLSRSAALVDAAPAVEKVFVASSTWTASFKQYLLDSGQGADGFAVQENSAQLLTMPWSNLDQIKIKFNEPVTVVQQDLLVKGSRVADYGISGFAYDPATNTATWTLSTPVVQDRILLHLRNTIIDTSFNALDGEWANGADTYPSGNGVEGGFFDFRLNVLAGDVNRNNTVNASGDVLEVHRRNGLTPANPGTPPDVYDAFHDVTGDAVINAYDEVDVRNALYYTLPATEPAAPTAPAAPSGLTGSYLNNWYNENYLFFLDTHFNDNSVDETGFRMERSRDGLTGWQPVSTMTEPDSPTHLTVGHVIAKYYYRIRAVNAAGASAPSNVLDKYYQAEDGSVQIGVQVQRSPDQINLNWPAWPHALSYKVYRAPVAGGAEVLLTPTPLPGNSTGYSDATAVAGTAYDYRVERTMNTADSPSPFQVNGRLRTAIELAPVHSRGKVLLVVDREMLTPANDPDGSLAAKLTRFQQDLVGDGWTVVRKPGDAPRHIPVPRTSAQTAQYKLDLQEVRNFVVGQYNADPANVKSVILFGHVTVPYSGQMFPDGHPEHLGAWPADSYYADVDGHLYNGGWTDTTVDTRGNPPAREENSNIPGDGKFDNNLVPDDPDSEDVELEIGRIDMANLPAMGAEADLLKRYLDKNHDYRFKVFTPQRRAVLDDSWGNGSSIRADFASLVGPGNTASGQYFPSVQNGSYLFAYAAGPGYNYDYVAGVGSTGNFALPGPTNAVFNVVYASRVVDWDSTNNFDRAAIADEGQSLTTAWGYSPYYRLALGGTVGSVNRDDINSVNNSDFESTYIALMGDPTLRIHTVSPVGNLTKFNTSFGPTILWGLSPDTDIIGYHIYREDTPGAPLTLLTTSGPFTGNRYQDLSAGASYTKKYMVRAVKLERPPGSTGATYLNMSEGKTV